MSDVAFLFSPVGWQREDMGRALYERGGVYRRVLRSVAAEMSPTLPMDLLEVLYPPKEGSMDMNGMIDSTAFAQPSLYAVQVALDALWRSIGVCPRAVLGHSVGEFAAAASGNGGLGLAAQNDGRAFEVTDDDEEEDEDAATEKRAKLVREKIKRKRARAEAGAWTHREGALCVAERARLMAAAPSAGGCMMSIKATEAACRAALKSALEDGSVSDAARVAIGAINGPLSTVLTGDYGAVSAVVAKVRQACVDRGEAPPAPRRVRGTSHADHSPAMAPLASALAKGVDCIMAKREYDILDRLCLQEEACEADGASSLLFASTVTGGLVRRADLRSGKYWAAHMTGAVLFTEALQALVQAGLRAFVEVGDGMLGGMGKAWLATTTPTLRGGRARAVSVADEYDDDEDLAVEWVSSLSREVKGDDAVAFSAAQQLLQQFADRAAAEAASPRSPRSSIGDPTSPRSPMSPMSPRSPRCGPRAPLDGAKPETILCKLQPPPHVYKSDPTASMTSAHDTTLTVHMPRDAPFSSFVAYLEVEYGTCVDVFDALSLGDHAASGKKEEAPGAIAGDAAFEAAFDAARSKQSKAAYFIVRPRLDAAGVVSLPRDSPKSNRTRFRAKAHFPAENGKQIGRLQPNSQSDLSKLSFGADVPRVPTKAQLEASRSPLSKSSFSRAAFASFASPNASFASMDSRQSFASLLDEGQGLRGVAEEELEDPGMDMDEPVSPSDVALDVPAALRALRALDASSGVPEAQLGDYDASLGRRANKAGYACAEFSPPQVFLAQAHVVAAMPAPSRLPEASFPSATLGGRCLDAWRYKWGQRSGDLWLYVPLPPKVVALAAGADLVQVDVSNQALTITVAGVQLLTGKFWHADATKGIDADSAAWVVVEHEGTQVLHLEMYKKKPFWWQAVWEGHPTIQIYEVPNWKDAAFNDGYTSAPIELEA
ncbi:hypothetical protein M885DRAFT_617659 [Pelagophyceae sp. CCMP2097]|nr:hypothetical protein M885DRAFT_617659 [Pelagophyceae sp. CCMP2097]